MTIILSRYHGKTIDFSRADSSHKSTIAHFLNDGKWNSDKLQDILKESIIHVIYQEAVRSRKPIFYIVDNTASHTKSLSQAEHPIEAAYFHQSHLKKCQNYEHQSVTVLIMEHIVLFNISNK